MASAIQIMKKVGLGITTDGKREDGRQGSSLTKLEFIYGVASDGLTSFESALHGKDEGDRLTVNIPAAEGQSYFGHLFPLVVQALGLQIMPKILHLEISVTAVSDADDREVVRSIAESVSHGGCGGSCGCGC